MTDVNADRQTWTTLRKLESKTPSGSVTIEEEGHRISVRASYNWETPRGKVYTSTHDFCDGATPNQALAFIRLSMLAQGRALIEAAADLPEMVEP